MSALEVLGILGGAISSLENSCRAVTVQNVVRLKRSFVQYFLNGNVVPKTKLMIGNESPTNQTRLHELLCVRCLFANLPSFQEQPPEFLQYLNRRLSQSDPGAAKLLNARNGTMRAKSSLKIFKGLRPTAGQGPKQRGGGCCCWHILGAMLAHSRGCVGHSWAIFGLCGGHLEAMFGLSGPYAAPP